MAKGPALLVADHEPATLPLVKRAAEPLSFRVLDHSSHSDILTQIEQLHPDVVLLGLQMAESRGLEVLKAVRDSHAGCAVILLTGEPSAETEMDAVKLGALDCLTKPLDLDRLRDVLLTVQKGIARREAFQQIDVDVARQFEFHGMIGRSAAVQELFDTIRRLAPHVRTLLITGETGTGKELVARAFHKVGPRRDRRFSAVNCSAVVDTLFESELFGHQRGAFTGATETKVGVFEHADQGTLFLDEVGELPMSIQPKLLRAVEYGELQRVGSLDTKRVDVRVIAATNRDLRTSATRRFRSDLYFRLSIMEIHLAPLRDRREDIPLLTAAFLSECARRINRPLTGITTAAERILQQWRWPGNIRELRNVVERACLLSEGKILTEREIQRSMTFTGASAEDAASETIIDDRLSSAERAQIGRVLKQVGGNKTEAAKILGISRRSLYRWIDRLALAGVKGPRPLGAEGLGAGLGPRDKRFRESSRGVRR